MVRLCPGRGGARGRRSAPPGIQSEEGRTEQEEVQQGPLPQRGLHIWIRGSGEKNVTGVDPGRAIALLDPAVDPARGPPALRVLVVFPVRNQLSRNRVR